MMFPVGSDEQPPRRRFPAVTATIIGINLAIFAIELIVLLTQGEDGLNNFFMNVGVVPNAVIDGESGWIPSIFTLVTAMFVHGSITHIGGNMLYLWAFGDNVEDRLGRLRFAIFYLLAGVLAGAAHIASGTASQIPSVGASGAIAGVLAAYVVLFPKGQVRLFIFLGPLTNVYRLRALIFIGLWFVMQVFSGVGSLGAASAETGGTAYWAHIGGFAAGLALVVLYRLLVEQRTAPGRREAGAGSSTGHAPGGAA